MAFLHFPNSSLSNLASVQHLVQLNLTLISATIVEWSRLARSAVCIFLNTEKPHSESALEQRIAIRPIISFRRLLKFWLTIQSCDLSHMTSRVLYEVSYLHLLPCRSLVMVDHWEIIGEIIGSLKTPPSTCSTSQVCLVPAMGIYSLSK